MEPEKNTLFREHLDAHAVHNGVQRESILCFNALYSPTKGGGKVLTKNKMTDCIKNVFMAWASRAFYTVF